MLCRVAVWQYIWPLWIWDNVFSLDWAAMEAAPSTSQEKNRKHIDKLKGKDGIESEDYSEFNDSSDNTLWVMTAVVRVMCRREIMSLHHLHCTLLPQQGLPS